MKKFEPFELTLTRGLNGDYYGAVDNKQRRRFCENNMHDYFDFPYNQKTIVLCINHRGSNTRYRFSLDRCWFGIRAILRGVEYNQVGFYDSTINAISRLLERLDVNHVYVSLEYDRE